MTLNPENNEPTTETTPENDSAHENEIAPEENPPEDNPAPEHHSYPINQEAPTNQSVPSDPSDPSDPSPELPSEAAEPATEADTPDITPDVIFEGDRPLVQELHYQAPRAKAGAPDEDETAEHSRFQSVSDARAVAEGFLFSSNEPLSVARLSKLMGNLHPKTVRGLLLELQWEYDNRGGALQITEIAGGYQMCTRPFVAPWMFRMHKLKRRSPLSPATLETLAIVAYRQPITKGEMEAIRGVETGAPIRTLQELGLIEASGRREVIGRPQLYITTEQFLKVFGLKSIADLPSISELKTRFADEQKLRQEIAPPPPATPESKAGSVAEANPEEQTADPDDQLSNPEDSTDENTNITAPSEPSDEPSESDEPDTSNISVTSDESVSSNPSDPSHPSDPLNLSDAAEEQTANQ